MPMQPEYLNMNYCIDLDPTVAEYHQYRQNQYGLKRYLPQATVRITQSFGTF